jgi:hypothetical protein
MLLARLAAIDGSARLLYFVISMQRAQKIRSYYRNYGPERWGDIPEALRYAYRRERQEAYDEMNPPNRSGAIYNEPRPEYHPPPKSFSETTRERWARENSAQTNANLRYRAERMRNQASAEAAQARAEEQRLRNEEARRRRNAESRFRESEVRSPRNNANLATHKAYFEQVYRNSGITNKTQRMKHFAKQWLGKDLDFRNAKRVKVALHPDRLKTNRNRAAATVLFQNLSH